MILNTTARIVYDKCDGNHSIYDIAYMFFLSGDNNIKLFDQIYKNIYDTLNVFDKHGILLWKNQNKRFLNQNLFLP